MKIKTTIAIFLFAIGLLSIVDWIIFTVQFKTLEFNEIKAKYIERLPNFIQSFYANSTGLVTLFFMLCLVIAGFLFIKETNKFFKLIGVIAFTLAFWELFSLM